jgi:hypothetical protein
MPTEEEKQEKPQGEQDGKQYNPSTLDDAMKVIEALQKRVGEREATINELRTTSNTLGERLTSIEQAAKKRLEEEGNWSELARQRQAELEALKPYQERAQALESVIRSSNEERLKRIPEDMRDLVPTDYPPEKLQTWLNANERRLVKQPAPNYDAGAGNGSGGSTGGVQVTDADKRAAEIAKGQGYNVTAEDIAKRRIEKQK